MLLSQRKIIWLNGRPCFSFCWRAFYHLFRAIRSGNRSKWFFLIFGVGCFLFALEEISWGQRIFGLESTKFFVENSDQQEINVHNVINEWFSIRTKNVAALALFTYGVVLPLAAINRNVRLVAKKLGVIVPSIDFATRFCTGIFFDGRFIFHRSG